MQCVLYETAVLGEELKCSSMKRWTQLEAQISEMLRHGRGVIYQIESCTNRTDNIAQGHGVSAVTLADESH